jgi:hypothetical protein
MPGLDDPIFCSRPNCPDRDLGVPYHDRAAARQWLEPLSRSFMGMRSLRAVIAAQASGRDSFRLSNQEILNEVSQLLSSGRLHVHSASPRRSGGSSGSAAPAESKPVLVAPSKPRSGPSAGPALTSDQPTFGSPVDASAQAAALTSAASEGKPFCPE